MANSNAPVFPYPDGTPGAEPPDPVAGKPGHFAWSRWIKQYVKNLNSKVMTLEDQVASGGGGGGGGGVTDHGALTGLADNDHPQYALAASLGDAATKNVGTSAGTVAAGDDSRIVSAVLWAPPPSGGDDTTALQAVLDAVPVAGGRVLLRAGEYSVPSGGLTCANPVEIVGTGAGDYENGGTRLLCSSSTATLLTLAAPGSVLSAVALVNTSGTRPTAGAGLLATDFDWGRVERCLFSGFWNNIQVDSGYFYSIRNTAVLAPRNYGVYLRNTASGQHDHGDMLIEGCNFSKYGDTTYGGTAVRWESGGGLRVVGNKINAGTQPGYTSTDFWENGIVAQMASGSTSVFVVSANSIEGFKVDGVRVGGDSGASFGQIAISGNEFLESASNSLMVKLDGTGMTALKGAVVMGNVGYGSGGGVGLTSITDVSVMDNNFSQLPQSNLTLSYVRNLHVSGNLWGGNGILDNDHNRHPYGTNPTAGHARDPFTYAREVDALSTNALYGYVYPGNYSATEVTIEVDANVATVGGVRMVQTRQLTKTTGAVTVGATIGTDQAYGPAAAEVSITWDVATTSGALRPKLTSVNGKGVTGSVRISGRGRFYWIRTS